MKKLYLVKMFAAVAAVMAVTAGCVCDRSCKNACPEAAVDRLQIGWGKRSISPGCG